MKKDRFRILASLCLLLIAAQGWSPWAHAQIPAPTKVSGKVVDEKGNPVGGATVSSSWSRSFRGAAKGTLSAFGGVTTDAQGQFSIEMHLYGRDGALLALDRDQKLGGLAMIPAKQADKPVTITLGPLTRVHGSFTCSELGKAPAWTNVYLSAMPGRVRVMMNDSEHAEFDVPLPPGTYQLWAYGTDVDDLRKEITIKPGTAELDLKALDLAATIIAKHKGKAPPAWHVTDARGLKKDVTLADFKGKWVLMEFWGFW